MSAGFMNAFKLDKYFANRAMSDVKPGKRCGSWRFCWIFSVPRHGQPVECLSGFHNAHRLSRAIRPRPTLRGHIFRYEFLANARAPIMASDQQQFEHRAGCDIGVSQPSDDGCKMVVGSRSSLPSARSPLRRSCGTAERRGSRRTSPWRISGCTF
jgi:hypothetical protein